MPTSYTRGGTTYRGVAAYIALLFSWPGLFIAIYILIGVFHNTAPPHIRRLPPVLRRSIAGYSTFISFLFWPLSFWHPVLTLGKWTVTGSITSP